MRSEMIREDEHYINLPRTRFFRVLSVHAGIINRSRIGTATGRKSGVYWARGFMPLYFGT